MTIAKQPRLYSGDIQIAILTSALAFEGYHEALNSTQLQFGFSNEPIRVTSNLKASWGTALASAIRPNPPTMTIGFNELPSEILAMQLLAETSALSVTGASVTDEDFVFVTGREDYFFDLQNEQVTEGSVVVQDDGDTITYTEGVDYRINYELGQISVIAGGAMAGSNATFHVDYDYGTYTGTRMQGNQKTTVNVRIKGCVYDIYTGRKGILTVANAALAPVDNIDFMNGEPVNAVFSGEMNVVSGLLGGAPMRFDDIDAA